MSSLSKTVQQEAPRRASLGSTNAVAALGVFIPRNDCAGGTRSKWSVLDMLGRIGCGYLILNRQGSVIEWNCVAQTKLEVRPDVAEQARAISASFRRLVANVPARFPPGSLSWVVSPLKGDKPIVLQEEFESGPEDASIVVLLDRQLRLEPRPHTLQQMFRLTGAETQLALRMARGDSPIEIARSSKLSRTTIRSQLASLFAKTETNRQAELVALLCRVAVLP